MTGVPALERRVCTPNMYFFSLILFSETFEMFYITSSMTFMLFRMENVLNGSYSAKQLKQCFERKFI